MGCALIPTAQSGRGGRGCCCEDVVDVYVRREEEEVVEEDYENNEYILLGSIRKGHSLQ